MPTAMASCLGALPGLRAEFHQLVRTEEESIVQETKGVLELLPPNRLRWEVHSPGQELLLVDGSYLWHHQPSLSQAIRYPLDFSSPLFVLLGSNRENNLEEKYKIQSFTRDGDTVYRFEGKGTEGDFSGFELGFSADCLPRRLSWEDRLGQKTEVRFMRAARTSPAPGRFRFVPPPGTDVVKPAS